MSAKSAGLLVYRIAAGGVVEVLIAHPGGPFWARKGDGSWTVPKGEYDESEDPLAAAFREIRGGDGPRASPPRPRVPRGAAPARR